MSKKILIVGAAIGIVLLGYLLIVKLDALSKSLLERNLGSYVSIPVQKISSHTATSTGHDKSGGLEYITATTSYYMIPNAAAYEGNTELIATSTLEFDIQGRDKATIGVFMISSSTASNLSFDFQISHDGSAWYRHTPTLIANTGNAGYSDGFLVSTSTYATWIPSLDDNAPTSTPSFSVDLTDIAARLMRMSVGAGGASSSAYIDVLLK